jgi:hypothetical protein
VTALLSSPRRRRRFAWIGGVLLAVTAIATAFVLSDPARQPPERLRAGTAPPFAREVRLTAAMRRGIDRTLAEFVPAAVGRKNPARAWKLAGPGLRAGGRLREWKAGLMPVQPYALAHRSLRKWRLIYAQSDRVAIDLMLFPRAGSREGPMVFGIDLVPRRRGWLVDSIFPAAIWSGKDERPFVTGAQDFTAKFGTKKSTYDKPKLPEARLSAVWLLVPGLIFGAAIVAPLVILARGLVSRRRRPVERMPAVPASFGRRP